MPRELFQQIRGQNLKNNLITEIRKIMPVEATQLENCPLQVVQNFVNAHNAKLAGLIHDPTLNAIQGVPHIQVNPAQIIRPNVQP